MQFQYVQFTFSLQFPIANTLTRIYVMVKKYHNMGDETQSVAEIAVQCGRGQGKYKCGRGANRNC